MSDKGVHKQLSEADHELRSLDVRIIIISVVILTFFLVLLAWAIYICCKKWRSKRNREDDIEAGNEQVKEIIIEVTPVNGIVSILKKEDSNKTKVKKHVHFMNDLESLKKAEKDEKAKRPKKRKY